MGILTARISTKELARLSRRLGISLAAGVDLRKTLEREASGAGRPALLDRLNVIRESVNAGESLAVAIRHTGEFFPLLFRELVAVGEQTGHLPAVFHQMADHYEFSIKQRKAFLAAIAGPMIQFTIAVCVIGGVIGLASVIKNDILGIGLTGTTGMVIWFGLIAMLLVGIGLLYRAFQRDLAWTRLIKRLAVRVPVIGHAITLVSMARLTWVLGLTFNSEMDVRHAIKLGLRASMHPVHLDQDCRVDGLVEEGWSVYEIFVHMDCFDEVFLDSLRAGDESGTIAETMTRLSGQYQERALLAISALSTAASWAVWLMVAGFIIFFIFRIFSSYVNTIYDAMG